MRPLRPIYRSDETKQSGEGQRYLATTRVCPRHDRSPPAISGGHRTSRARPSGDLVTIRSSRPQIQSATSNLARDMPRLLGRRLVVLAYIELLAGVLLGFLARQRQQVEGSLIPSFFEIKESAGREFFPKRIGGAFFEACADCHIECSRRTTKISPIRGADEPGTRQWRRCARVLRSR
jgi:hypothetical protein